jgi:iron(III) transport system substrate-binding protein
MKFMILFLCACSLALAACSKANDKSETGTQQRVTLYTSVDDEFARMVVAQFEAETGIMVDVLGDTEATKTTGLVTRLQSEKDNPTCDVWWSSEPMGTILLARDGLLEPWAMQGTVEESWPSSLCADDWSWVGTALRSRVIVYPTDRIGDLSNVPDTLALLAHPDYRGRIGMARPQFGTTRIHMALAASQWGLVAFGDWIAAVQNNNIRLYDGNAGVVRGVAMGEIDFGLTDTDDVWSGQANNWAVDFVRESQADHPTWMSLGETQIPNTVAIIQGAPNPDAASQLAAFLVSPSVERLLFESTSGNAPVDPDLRAQCGLDSINEDSLPDYVRASALVEEAMDLCERILGP